MWMRMSAIRDQRVSNQKIARGRLITDLWSGQILLGNGGAEPVVIANESGDELVQAGLENAVHAAVLQPRAQRAGLPLGRTLAAIVGRQRVEVLHQVLVAAGQRARHLLVEDEHGGDEPWLEALAIDPMI